MNPFEINTMPIDMINELLCREKEIQQIKEHVNSRKQTVILGVEGVGKTSLLNSVFNREYRKQKALEGTLVSPVTEFPTDLIEEDNIYMHFAEMIINSVEILSQCGETEKMNAILNRCNDIRKEKHSAEIYFEKIVNLIYRTHGYHIVMVVDNFERFTSSKVVTMKHHETLRKLLHCSQYIVATNYDLNEDSLPPGVSGSHLLMNFAGNEIRVGGWSYEQTAEYINNKLKADEIKFSNELCKSIYRFTGGIPLLSTLAANYAYNYVSANRTEVGLNFTPLYEQEIVQALFFRWCKMITPMQITAIQHLFNGCCNGDDEKKLRCLYLRGALNYKITEDKFGNRIVRDNQYNPNCVFLGIFFRNEENLKAAAAKNPLAELREMPTVSTLAAQPEDLSIPKQNILNAVHSKLATLETALREARANIEAEIEQYRNLGNRISADSKILKRLEKQAKIVDELRIEIDSKFDIMVKQIRNATTEDELKNIKVMAESTSEELAGELKAIKKVEV